MYKVAYAKINNAGDLFNEALLDYFNVKYEVSNVFEANLTMLGGMLSALLPSDELKLRLWQNAMRFVNDLKKPLHVWGTGFLVGSLDGDFMRTNLIVHALRGDLSRQKLEGILGRKLDVLLCDPGLLACKFVDRSIDKQYRVGIIPHFREQSHPVFLNLKNSYENAVIIDITRPYQEVLNEIAACELILSSSLHGLIFSDSLNIPNCHIVVTNKLAGDGFKFTDYYSSYGYEHLPFKISTGQFPDLSEIMKKYKISKDEVEEKTGLMIEAFPQNL